MAAFVSAASAVVHVVHGVDAVSFAHGPSDVFAELSCLAGASDAELAGRTFLAAGTTMIWIKSIVYFAPGALLPVAVGIVYQAFAYSSYAVAPYSACVVALTAVVVVELEVNTHVVAEILPLGARVVVVTATGGILLKKDYGCR